MEYSISFKEKDYENLCEHLFKDRSSEKAAFLLCGFSQTQEESRLLVREIEYVQEQEILNASATNIEIKSAPYVRVTKKARAQGLSVVYVHSHPEGFEFHSQLDDEEERELFKFIHKRVRGVPFHGSLVISTPEKPRGRVCLPDGTFEPFSVVRVIGRRFKFFHAQEKDIDVTAFDRQLDILTVEGQKIISSLKVGVVGVGGTGSAVVEQLVRMGIREIYVFDKDTFESTNINRVYGSKVGDIGVKKVDIQERHIQEIGLPVTVKKFTAHITHKETAEELRNCDLIFGCTDDHRGRLVLSRLSLYYYIPIIDMGISIDSSDGLITGIDGRVSVLSTGDPCLLCTSVVDIKIAQSEFEEEIDPDKAREKRKEGYLVGLPGRAPSVVSFTTMIASAAVIEFLHRIAGIITEEKSNNNIYHRFDNRGINKMKRGAREECFCKDLEHQGRGDIEPFLGVTW